MGAASRRADTTPTGGSCLQARWRGVHSPHPPVVEAASRASSPALVCSESRSTASLHRALSQSYAYIVHRQFLSYRLSIVPAHVGTHDMCHCDETNAKIDTNRHMMCWVRETFCTGERYGPRLIFTHQTYHQPTASVGREAGGTTTTATTCSPCGCREAWWKSKRKSKAQQEKKKITGADNCTSYAFQTD